MVSPLWNACSEGDLQKVQELLRESSNSDIEVRNHNGVTPLIEAVKNGHVEVVKALLDHGADPINSSSYERPETYTSVPAILDLLRQAQDKMVNHEVMSPENVYHHVSSEPDVPKHYYGQPPAAYPYYPPPMNGVPPPMPDGAGVYYPPPPPHAPGENPTHGGLGNLPPPEIARSIPCRYFPACRYGASCMFAHPQNPSYYQGPPPTQAQYMPYDPSLGPQPYVPNYYPAPPPPTFQQPNGVQHLSPMSPPPGPSPTVHGHSSSELISPASNPYVTNGMSPLPYGSMLPPVYPPQGHMPVPMSASPMSSVHPQPPVSLPQSPSVMYNQPPPHPAPVYNGQPDVNGSYPPPPATAPIMYTEPDGDVNGPPPPHPNDGFPHNSHGYRDGAPSHGRRGSGRKGSFGSRKPACLFFPTGRCKNGNDCRFPHVPLDSAGSQNIPYSNRGGPRPRGNSTVNGFTAIDDKLANLNIRDVPSRPDASPKDGRSKFERGSRSHNGGNVNGVHVTKRSVPTKQRVPNADDFPVLGGSITPPARQANGLPIGAPTAAQVLQAPPPKKEGSQASPREPSPDSAKVNGVKAPINGVHEDSGASSPTTDQPQHNGNKLPLSFAAAASSTGDVF